MTPSLRTPLRAWSRVAALAALLALLAACTRSGAPPPDISVVSAEATTRTSLTVTFSAPVGVGADVTDNYRITAPSGARLDVLAAYPDGGTKVVLATDVQDEVTYVLNVQGIAAAGAPAGGTFTSQGGFGGSGEIAPILASAIALSNTEVLLTFGDPANGKPSTMVEGVDNPEYYEITGPDLEVVSADPGTDPSTVVLTTEPMDKTSYTVRATNLLDRNGQLLDPFLNTGVFNGIPLNDGNPPELLGVTVVDNTTIVLDFSEPLGDGAEDPARYRITDSDGAPLLVTNAVLNEFRTRVTLTTYPQIEGESYTLVVDGIEDRSGNEIDAGGITEPFDGGSRLTPPGDDTDPPKLSNAGSLSNTEIAVTFSEPVTAASAENPAHYRVTADLLDGSLESQATLEIESATLSGDGTRVTLTTLAQSEIRYTLEVTGVQDLAGNQISPKDRLTGATNVTTFVGTPPGGTPVDSDGDGLSDAEEQLGWIVTVELANGDTVRREVTSDPGDPSLPVDDAVNIAARDTDGDDLPDGDEKTYLTDPRNRDTDSDDLSDWQELNRVYSEPAVQDTDGDGLADGLEHDFFSTSALYADTDGDGLDDGYEVTTDNRNARVADLPQPRIEIGQVDLALDVRFETEVQQGEEAVDSKTREVTLQRDESQTMTTTDTNTNEWFFNAGATVGAEFEFPKFGGSASVEFSTEGGKSGSTTFEVSEQSARSSSRTYSDTVSTENSYSREESLSRNVEAAEIGALVNVINDSNIAFTMTNLEITALVKDPRDPRILTPVATLFAADPDTSIGLGALDTNARGPFRFVDAGAFPQRVEELMRNPRSVVFEVANYTIRDAEGRDFVFGEQRANDRTAPLTLDFGVQEDDEGVRIRGATERYRVATNGEFDDAGRSSGITVAEALEQILGLTHYDEAAVPSADLTDDEKAESYSTLELDDGSTIVWRVRGTAPDVSAADFLAGTPLDRSWVALTDAGIADDIRIRDYVLRAERGLTLAYVQDRDGDDVPARIEFSYGSFDDPLALPSGVTSALDSDGDGVGGPSESDNFEIYTGWAVTVDRGLGLDFDERTFQVFPSPARSDTDGDGLSDWEEWQGCRDADGNRACDRGFGVSIDDDGNATYARASTDPTNPDTDGDGIPDGAEVNSYSVDLRLTGTTESGIRSDPTAVDTDRDGVADGDEVVYGGNPAKQDVASYTDTDGDGLLDQEEEDGWTVTYYETSTVDGQQGKEVEETATSDPSIGSVDTDGDGLTDLEEKELGTHPRRVDTDGDGYEDAEEIAGLTFGDETRTPDPLDADSDDDRLSDFEELAEGWDVVLGGVATPVASDPLDRDADGDDLADFGEKSAGTDPNDADTDGDATTDKVEVDRNADADETNDTDPLEFDQLLVLSFDAQAVRYTNDLICGELPVGSSSYFTASLSVSVNGTESTSSFGRYVNTDRIEDVFSGNYIYRTGSITAAGSDIRRFENGPGTVNYDLGDFSETFTPTNGGLFEITEKQFVNRQDDRSDDLCRIDFFFQIEPVAD